MSNQKWELHISEPHQAYPYLLTLYRPENNHKIYDEACERYNEVETALARARQLVKNGWRVDVTLDVAYSTRINEDDE